MIPRPTLEQSVAALSDRDEYKVIIGFIREERERMFGDLRQAETSNDVMKVAGSVATLDEMLQMLSPQ
jgi:histidinol-phosphate/aromatic aminotransferase/cobyric acid decarboxylase-like protein